MNMYPEFWKKIRKLNKELGRVSGEDDEPVMIVWSSAETELVAVADSSQIWTGDIEDALGRLGELLSRCGAEEFWQVF